MFVGMDNTTDAGSRVYLEVANFAENRLPLAGLVLATVLFLVSPQLRYCAYLAVPDY